MKGYENLKRLVLLVILQCISERTFIFKHVTVYSELVSPNLDLGYFEFSQNDHNTIWTLQTFGDFLNVAIKEEEIYKITKERLSKAEIELELINFFIEACERSSENNLNKKEDGKVISSNAILSHRMTYRYATVTQNLRNFLTSKEYKDNCESSNAILETHKTDKLLSANSTRMKWPTLEDLYLSHRCLLNLHMFHGSTPSQLSQGLTLDTKAGGKLSALNSLRVGLHAFTTDLSYVAIEWFEYTRYLVKRAEMDSSVSLHFIQQFINISISEHNLFKDIGFEGKEDYKNYYYMNTYLHPTYDGQSIFERRPGRMDYFQRVSKDSEDDLDLRVLKLCNGYDLQSKEIKAKMKCYLERNLHPYLILNPLKVETLSESPSILHIYDVVGNSMLKEIRKFATKPEFYHTTKTSENSADIRNVLKYGWWAGAGSVVREDNLLLKLYTRTEMVTGLKVKFEEWVQFMWYTYGRYYSLHSDLIANTNNDTDTFLIEHGNRLVSVLYYVETPKVGGYTPFPQAGVAAKGVKGSVLIWINMYRNGTLRDDNNHAACPVIHGEKQAINVFMAYNSNFQSFQCSLNQFE